MTELWIGIGAGAASFALSALLIPRFLPVLKRLRMGQNVSEFALDEFKTKQKVPTMGGLFFVIIPVLISLAFNFKRLSNPGFLLILLAFIGYGMIGFADDLKIILEHKNDGLKPWVKFSLQLLIAVIFYWLYHRYTGTVLYLPLGVTLELGVFYAVLILFMFVGASNAVNLTDGMDGLAGGTSIFAYVPYLVFAYQAHEFAIFTFVFAVIGSLIGYLLYNMYPAQIIMGDTGSLALGGGLAALSLVLKKEILLIIIGGVFVVETLCVLIQQTSVRLFKKKVFRYTPIHYAFTLNGWKEKNVVGLFWMIACALMIIGIVLGALL